MKPSPARTAAARSGSGLESTKTRVRVSGPPSSSDEPREIVQARLHDVVIVGARA